MIRLVVEVGGKNEWWRVVIGWEENIDGEVIIFWDEESIFTYCPQQWPMGTGRATRAKAPIRASLIL